MSATITTPDSGSQVSGNPLHVVVHYNTTVKYIPPGQPAVMAPAATTWRLDCTVTGISPTTGNWSMSAMVAATGAAGADQTFDFLQQDGSAIPVGDYKIYATLTKFVTPPGTGTGAGSDTHNPVHVV